MKSNDVNTFTIPRDDSISKRALRGESAIQRSSLFLAGFSLKRFEKLTVRRVEKY